MTNDIRKNIMLIESIILDESFKDAQKKFSSTANPDEVKSYIDKFKELSKRNIIKGEDKDIGFWIKGDWDDFKTFIDNNSSVVTNRQTKAVQKKDSIVVYKDEEKQVVIPLTKEASIQYGKNTKWCTAATESTNHFINYFYMRKITLFYVLFKDGNKYACAFHPKKPDTMQCFDQADKSMTFDKFEKATGITKEDIQNWYNSNKSKIEDSRDLNKCSEEVQLDAVQQNGLAIEHIDNPSEEVQLAAVQRIGSTIRYIKNPSEKVQLSAVTKDGTVIKVIKNPSEELQLAAVTQDGRAIKYIIDNGIVPSEQVQLAAVTQSGSEIQFIDNPSEEVQLATVTQSGYTIKHIIDKGIVPSEEVQIAAVTRSGGAIVDIVEKGIIPSEAVQLVAVTKSRYAIDYIDNPSEKVKASHKKLWGSN